MKITNNTASISMALLLLLSGCGDDSSDDKGSRVGDSKLVISEVLADNNSINTDPDSDLFGDWVEVQNVSSSQLDISGYGLSDSKKKVKWNFPNGTTVPAGKYLLVWADDLNLSLYPNPTALHTNFKIKKNKDSVSLFDKSGTLIDQVKLEEYKTYQPDISIARHGNDFALSSTPTPAQTNDASSVAASKKPDFSVKEGVYDSEFEVEITASNGADIFYTIDGSKPTVDSTLYTRSITISGNKTTLKAVAKEKGSSKLVSNDRSKTYVIREYQPIVIREIFADDNASSPKWFQSIDWIELYNTSDAAIDLVGYRLSDSKKLENSQWKFPEGTTISANGYLEVYADKTDSGLHTDFKLSDSGDSVVLYNRADEIIEFVDYEDLKDGQSLKRVDVNDYVKRETSSKSEW